MEPEALPPEERERNGGEVGFRKNQAAYVKAGPRALSSGGIARIHRGVHPCVEAPPTDVIHDVGAAFNCSSCDIGVERVHGDQCRWEVLSHGPDSKHCRTDEDETAWFFSRYHLHKGRLDVMRYTAAR